MKILGEIGQAIEQYPEEKESIKLMAFTELLLPFTFGREGRLISIEAIRINALLAALELDVTVNGEKIGDGILQFINPPILVNDGTFTEVQKEIDGEIVIVSEPNYVENLEEALKSIIWGVLCQH